MKLIYACLTLFIVTANIAKGQQMEDKIAVAITGGLSFPTGRFGNKNFVPSLNKPNGLAKPGYNFNASFFYRHKPKFGFSFLVGYSSHKQDLANFAVVSEPRYGVERPNVDIIEKSWKIFKTMGGVYVESPLFQNVNLTIRPALSIGVVKATKPESRVFYHYRISDILALSQNGKLSFPLSWALQTDINLLYKLTNKLYAIANANYFFANPVYKFPNEGNTKSRYNISSINVLLGVGIKF